MYELLLADGCRFFALRFARETIEGMSRVVGPLLLTSAVGSLGLLLSGCGGGGSGREGPTTKQARSSRIGVNLHYADTWSGSRPFNNLIYGSNWSMQKSNGGWEDVPEARLDSRKWVKSTPTSEYRVVRGLSAPSTSSAIICRFKGTGQLDVGGESVSNVVRAMGKTTFNYRAPYPVGHASAYLAYKITDHDDYIRDIDCRESGAAGTYAPDFIATLRGFSALRFMKWQSATEGNWRVTWASRSKPGDGEYLAADGVPIEHMLELAALIGADPWVTVPWNADDDYVRRFATYVRDKLPPDRQVYVEVSNEVWNGANPVATQAKKEAVANRLEGADGAAVGGNLERYAQKTQQVMAIWSDVFADEMDRIVRIAAFQHVQPYLSDSMLGYRELHKSIDALSTAPYFGYELRESDSFEMIIAALSTTVASSISFMAQQKAVAERYGLRYVAYEGGQHLVFPNNVRLLARVQRAREMQDAYSQYLDGWAATGNDTIALFALQGAAGKSGAWGLVEWVGQPHTEAPKMRAVRNFISKHQERGSSANKG